MIEIEDKLLSDDLFEEYFCCDLTDCKGACCIEGDSGAPLEIDEIGLIEDNIDVIKPYMSRKGIEAITTDGVFTIDSDGDYTTTLIGGAECAFVFRDKGIALCAIEKAYREGKIKNIKPISCHLYPIRRKRFSDGTEGLNYHRWDVCKGAVRNGAARECKVYEGVQSAIERAYGKEFYDQMTEIEGFIERGELKYEE